MPWTRAPSMLGAPMSESFDRSVIKHPISEAARNVKKVPFVELRGGRVQGVVSSGSDLTRVYVSFFEAHTGAHYCCTNNNRPCGGLRGGTCKHIETMIKEAQIQFGPEPVARYLGLKEEDASDPYAIVSALPGPLTKESSGAVFSRFLAYLRVLELPQPSGAAHEMAWFVA